jgi:hypothetical protein
MEIGGGAMGSCSDHAMPTYLVIRSDPAPGESMIGYLRRLCIANGYDSLQWIFEKNISSPHELFVEENLRRIADVTGCDYRLLREAGYIPVNSSGSLINFCGIEIEKSHIDIDVLNICTECLSERLLHHPIWDLVDCTSCPIHGTKIANRCPVCGSPLSWMRASNTCECGIFEFEDYCAGKSQKNEFICAKHIYSLLRYEVNSNVYHEIRREIRMLSLNDFLRSIRALYTIPTFEKTGRKDGVYKLTRISKRRNVCVNYSMGVLMNWPSGFYAHVEKIANFILMHGNLVGAEQGGMKRLLIILFFFRMKNLSIKIDPTGEVWNSKGTDLDNILKFI